MQTKDRLYVHVFSKIQSQTEAGLKLEVLKVAGSESMKTGSGLTCSARWGRFDYSTSVFEEDSEPRGFDPHSLTSLSQPRPIKSPKPADIQRPAEPRRDTWSPASAETSLDRQHPTRRPERVRLTLRLDT